MKRILSLCSISLLATLAACSSAPKDAANPGGDNAATPLLDRELFFGDPLITGAQLSPDGQYIAFIKPYKDVRNIWVKRTEESFDKAKPITADQRPVSNYFWSRDGRYVLYVQDKGGNENFNVYAVDPAAGPEAATGVPSARNLTNIEGARALVYSVPRNDPSHILVGLNDRDPAYHDVYKVNLATGQRTLLLENNQKIGFYIYDQNGNVRLAMRQIPGGSTELLRVEGSDLVRIYTTTYKEQAFPIRFHPDGKRVYMRTNKGDNVDLAQLVLMDVQTGKTELIESDPEKQVDFASAAFDDETDELLATVYVGDRTRIYPKNDAVKRDLEIIRSKVPDGDLHLMSSTKDLRLMLMSISSDVDPGSVYLYNRDKGSVDLVYKSRPELPSQHLAPMQPVRYKARDGLEIPAYLTTPKGAEAKNLPTVIFVHGGPWARDAWGYDGFAQFLANRGYAVLQPNFRSSSGYGKKFLNAGNRTWGTGAMQHDITDGVNWLIGQGITDPKKVCIFGGSYGGYATLAGVTFTPDLYTCGVPYVAPSSLITLIESFPAYWRPFLEGTWYKRVGDPANDNDRKDLEARSPLNFVNQIKVPLLVVHGANDPRVKQAESDQIIVALREKGHAVEYIVAPDEGHGFRGEENRMALAVAIERFLGKHLGGRVQQEVPGNVSTRLGAITVDVNKVTMPTSADAEMASAAMTAPLPKTDGARIKPANIEYKGSLEAGPQTMELTVQRTIKSSKLDGKSTWQISDTVALPMGKVSDTAELDKTTLRPIKQTYTGMSTGELAFTDKSIKGSMASMGQNVDVDVALDAPVWANGTGFVISLASLPLAEGYHTTIRWFDASSQKVEAFKLTVTGTESTTVPGGTFDTYVVKMDPLGDATANGVMRVTRTAPHHIVKAEYQLSAASGGMKVKSELAKMK